MSIKGAMSSVHDPLVQEKDINLDYNGPALAISLFYSLASSCL